MLWVIYWCPEEDVELSILCLITDTYFRFQNIKAVPKAVL